jgi:hypothetical protein
MISPTSEGVHAEVSNKAMVSAGSECCSNILMDSHLSISLATWRTFPRNSYRFETTCCGAAIYKLYIRAAGRHVRDWIGITEPVRHG